MLHGSSGDPDERIEDGNSASVLHVRSDWESYGGLGRRLNPLPLLTV